MSAPQELLLALLCQAESEAGLDVGEKELLTHRRTAPFIRAIHAAYDAGADAAEKLEGVEPVHDVLWRLIDWCLWGAGVGDELREKAANIMTAVLPAEMRQQIVEIEDAWRRHRLGEDGHPGHARLAMVNAELEEAQRRVAELESQLAAASDDAGRAASRESQEYLR